MAAHSKLVRLDIAGFGASCACTVTTICILGTTACEANTCTSCQEQVVWLTNLPYLNYAGSSGSTDIEFAPYVAILKCDTNSNGLACTCMFLCRRHAYLKTCLHMCVYAYMHICIYAKMHVCIYACMHICRFVCTHMYMYIYI